MGTRLTRYTFVPKENEQIDTTITLEEDVRSVIHGVVKDCKGRPVKDAVVKLLRAKDCEDPCVLKPITHTFTDDCGQFLFGPLCPGKKYVVKVWAMDLKPCKPCEDESPKEEYIQVDAVHSEKMDMTPKNRILAKDHGFPENYYQRQ